MSNHPDDLGPRLRKSLNHGTAPELSTDVVTGAANRTPPKLSNPTRNLSIAGGATVLVAAVAVTALVLGPTLNRAPLFTVAAASSASDESGRAGLPSANVPSAHGLFRIWANYVYKAGANLSTAGGNGDVHQLTRSGSGESRIDDLASTFGLAGQPVSKDDSDKSSPTYTIGTIDGSTPALYLVWAGTGDWSYSDEDAVPAIGCAPADGATSSSGDSGSGSGDSGGGCDATQPSGPNDAPTGDDARAQAQKIFAETGLDVSKSDIQLESDSSQTTATANLEVDGVKTALGWGVTWSSAGKISYAYGSSVNVVDRGSFGTISAADAVARLSDSRWSGQAGPKYSGGIRPFAMLNGDVGSTGGTVSNPPVVISSPAPATLPSIAPTDAPDNPSGGPTSAPGSSGGGTPVPDVTPTPEPAPTAPPTIVVTVNTADPTLLLMWDSKGNGWLVPGYAMKVENGFWNSVVSLVPGVIELPPLPSVEPDDVAPTTGN